MKNKYKLLLLFISLLHIFYQKYVQRLRSELNQLQMENADLRAEVTRLRYTAHPANAHVNAAVTQRQLKVKVNQLAVENQDLKSAVGKMRYTVHPGNEDNTTGK